MHKFQCLLFVFKQSYICYCIIRMIVPLRSPHYFVFVMQLNHAQVQYLLLNGLFSNTSELSSHISAQSKYLVAVVLFHCCSMS